ncbi:MAG: phosphodiester glycosidase family protein [Verrucomicrobiales bacterium]|nr:phosphodiester glycosidase family protein [Verrucomicrobiales bacterium]
MHQHFAKACHLSLFNLILFLSPLNAEIVQHRGTSFHVYRVEADKDAVQLLLAKRKGKPNKFTNVRQRLEKKGRQLKFAMNSGIFEGNFMPTGLHVSEGKTITPLNLTPFVKEREGQLTPNFFLEPNGVFFMRKDGTSGILESHAYAKSQIPPHLATQSGPLLVHDGTIHPVLGPDSTSTRLRNGVGVDEGGNVIFVCSVHDQKQGRSNLYRFAEFFRDVLKCANALYLDGDISYVYIRGETGPIEDTNWFAGILAITEPAP